MPMPKVSILVPIYNAEKYLKQCLDSVVNQTLRDIEIICIDDGSTDSTLHILREYENLDSRVKVISKPNSGYGASMNIGLKTATGEYIGIVESDDYAELNMFEVLYKKAKEHDLDLIGCQHFRYSLKENTKIAVNRPFIPINKLISPLDDNEKMVFKQGPAIWDNIVKKSLIDENNIYFLQTPGASYQDSSYVFKLVACAKRFMMIEDVLYHYVGNENSSIRAKGNVYALCVEFDEIKRFAIEKGIYQKLKTLLPMLRYAAFCWNYTRIDRKFKRRFLLKWHKIALLDFIEGNIDKKMISKKAFKRLAIIAFCPFLYYFRRKGFYL